MIAAVRSTRVLTIVLLAAIALNLGIGGYLVGHVVGGDESREAVRAFRTVVGGPRPPRHGPIEELAGLLSPPDARILRENVGRREGEFAGERQALRQARETARAALSAQPYDQARLETALASARRHAEAMQVILHGALVESVADMSPEGRARLAEWRRLKR